MFTSFLPGISNKAQKSIREEVRNWRLQLKVDRSIKDIAEQYNPKIQGWINYYSHFYKEELRYVLAYINKCISKWAKHKYKKIKSRRRAGKLVTEIAKREPELFAHWKFGVIRTAM